MNTQEKIEAWVKALRSGEYQQTTSRLKDSAGYCCLGVLEQVLEGKVETHENGCALGYPTDEFLARQGFISGEFPNGDPASLVRSYLRGLAEWNDSGRHFSEIADHIESTASEVIK